MKKFFKINFILIRNAFTRDMRLSFPIITSSLNNLIDGSVSIALILLVYSKTEYISGWNLYETLILISSVQIIIILHSSWTKRGTGSFAESMVRMGDYDFYLTKPFNPMISVSISKPRIYTMIKLPFFIFIFWYAVAHLGHAIGTWNILAFAILFVLGFLLFYAIRIMTVIPAFWIIKSHTLATITDRVQYTMKYPAAIYPRAINLIFTTILPIFVVSYLPVKALLFEPKLSYIIYSAIITTVFLFAADRLWKFGETHYGSASS